MGCGSSKKAAVKESIPAKNAVASQQPAINTTVLPNTAPQGRTNTLSAILAVSGAAHIPIGAQSQQPGGLAATVHPQPTAGTAAAWLATLQIPQYAAAFKRAGYDDLATLAHLEDEDLDHVQRFSQHHILPGHRKKLLLASKQLSQEHEQPPSSSSAAETETDSESESESETETTSSSEAPMASTATTADVAESALGANSGSAETSTTRVIPPEQEGRSRPTMLCTSPSQRRDPDSPASSSTDSPSKRPPLAPTAASDLLAPATLQLPSKPLKDTALQPEAQLLGPVDHTKLILSQPPVAPRGSAVSASASPAPHALQVAEGSAGVQAGHVGPSRSAALGPMSQPTTSASSHAVTHSTRLPPGMEDAAIAGSATHSRVDSVQAVQMAESAQPQGGEQFSMQAASAEHGRPPGPSGLQAAGSSANALRSPSSKLFSPRFREGQQASGVKPDMLQSPSTTGEGQQAAGLRPDTFQSPSRSGEGQQAAGFGLDMLPPPSSRKLSPMTGEGQQAAAQTPKLQPRGRHATSSDPCIQIYTNFHTLKKGVPSSGQLLPERNLPSNVQSHAAAQPPLQGAKTPSLDASSVSTWHNVAACSRGDLLSASPAAMPRSSSELPSTSHNVPPSYASNGGSAPMSCAPPSTSYSLLPSYASSGVVQPVASAPPRLRAAWPEVDSAAPAGALGRPNQAAANAHSVSIEQPHPIFQYGSNSTAASVTSLSPGEQLGSMPAAAVWSNTPPAYDVGMQHAQQQWQAEPYREQGSIGSHPAGVSSLSAWASQPRSAASNAALQPPMGGPSTSAEYPQEPARGSVQSPVSPAAGYLPHALPPPVSTAQPPQLHAISAEPLQQQCQPQRQKRERPASSVLASTEGRIRQRIDMIRSGAPGSGPQTANSAGAHLVDTAGVHSARGSAAHVPESLRLRSVDSNAAEPGGQQGAPGSGQPRDAIKPLDEPGSPDQLRLSAGAVSALAVDAKAHAEALRVVRSARRLRSSRHRSVDPGAAEIARSPIQEMPDAQKAREQLQSVDDHVRKRIKQLQQGL